ncbi:MAG: hypothetical protein Q9216_007094, partial [Gyalolechia sp. 2 TL-2023]
MKFLTTIAAVAVLLPLAIAAPAPTDSTDLGFEKLYLNDTVTYDDLIEVDSNDDENELEKRKVTKSNIEIRTFKGAHCQASAVVHRIGFNANYPGSFKSFLLNRDLKLGESIAFYSDEKCTKKKFDSGPIRKNCYNGQAKCLKVWRRQ